MAFLTKFKSLATTPFRLFYKTVSSPIKESLNHGKSLKENASTVVEEMKAGRDPRSENAPDLNDFREVLNHWQITEKQLPKVIKGLSVRTFIFGALGIYGLYLLGVGIRTSVLSTLFAAVLLITLGVTAVITGIWRIKVLREREFIPFRAWIKQLWQ